MGTTESKQTLPGESCKDYVGRVSESGYYLVNPWVDNMAGWSETMGSSNPFPRDGANDPFHMDMVKGLCFGDEEAFPWYGGDPRWDKDYMEKGGIQWLKLAPEWKKTNPETGKKVKGNKTDPKVYHNREKERCSKKSVSCMPTAPPPYVHPLYPQIDGTIMAGILGTTVQTNPVVPRPATPRREEGAHGEADSSQDEAPVDVPVYSPHYTRSRQMADNQVGSSNLMAPFMTVGNVLVRHPLGIDELNKIIKYCPKPHQAPAGTVAYLKRACNGRNFTQEDMRLIIDGIIDRNSEWDWTKVPTINTPDDHQSDTGYALNTPAGRENMWQQVTTEMTRVFKAKSSLPVALTCKPKSGETVTEFWKRFKDCWTQEAGLPVGVGHDPLLISTFLGNLPHDLALICKQQVSGWTTKTNQEFEKSLFEKEASGCFDIKKRATPESHHYQQTKPMNKPKRDDRRRCYNCGREGHFARDCKSGQKKPDQYRESGHRRPNQYQPRESAGYTQQRPQQTQVQHQQTQQNPPTHRIEWGSQTR